MHKGKTKTLEEAVVGKRHRTEHKRHAAEPALPPIIRCNEHKMHLVELALLFVVLGLHLVELAIGKASNRARRQMM